MTEQQSEGFGQLIGHGVVVADVQSHEEGLVALAPDGRVRLQVSRVAVLDEGQYLIKVEKCAPEPLVGDHEVILGRDQLLADAILLDLQEVQWDGTGIVGLQELVALVQQAPAPLGVECLLLDEVAAAGLKVFPQ